MQSHWLRMHEIRTLDIQCQFVNVSSDRRSQFIIHVFSFRLNIIAKQLVVDVRIMLYRAAEPLKSVALSNLTNVLIG